MAQMCEKLDAKLAYTYSYSYSLNTNSTSSIPFQSPKSDTGIKTDTTSCSPTMASETARRLSEPQSDIHNPTAERPPFNSVISWTSDATRRDEYAKIDRANSGLRGFFRKLMPRPFLSRNSRRDFFTGKCDGDSVRRFRMDVADDEESHASEDPREHEAPVLASSTPRAEASTTTAEGEKARQGSGKNLDHAQETPRRRWSCF